MTFLQYIAPPLLLSPPLLGADCDSRFYTFLSFLSIAPSFVPIPQVPLFFTIEKVLGNSKFLRSGSLRVRAPFQRLIQAPSPRRET